MTASSAYSATNQSGTAIEFKFPIGRYHATAMGTAPNDGVVEWPPSTWRVVRALYSVWRSRCPNLTDEQVLPVLDALSVAPDYDLPTRTFGAHTRHYMPGDNSGAETRFLGIDSFVACDPADSLTMVWPEVELKEAQREVLERLCCELTWLGRAESLCDARLLPLGTETAINTSPAMSGDASTNPIRLLVPHQPLDEAALTVRPDELRLNAKTRSTMPPNAQYVTYSRPERATSTVSQGLASHPARPTAVRFELTPWDPGRGTPRLPMSELLLYTSLLRSAVISKRDGNNDGTTSVALGGHVGSRQAAVGHQHAHYLALPALGGAQPDRWIDSLVIWAPGGLDDEDLNAILRVQKLSGLGYLREFKPVRLVCAGFGDVRDVVPDWLVDPTRKATHWSSVTPMVPGRHHKGRHDWSEQIRVEALGALGQRGLPPATVSVEKWGGRFRGDRPQGTRNRNHSKERFELGYSRPFDVSLTFEAPPRVEGPLTLGKNSHFGLGLFMPVTRTVG